MNRRLLRASRAKPWSRDSKSRSSGYRARLETHTKKTQKVCGPLDRPIVQLENFRGSRALDFGVRRREASTPSPPSPRAQGPTRILVQLSSCRSHPAASWHATREPKKAPRHPVFHTIAMSVVAAHQASAARAAARPNFSGLRRVSGPAALTRGSDVSPAVALSVRPPAPAPFPRPNPAAPTPIAPTGRTYPASYPQSIGSRRRGERSVRDFQSPRAPARARRRLPDREAKR